MIEELRGIRRDVDRWLLKVADAAGLTPHLERIVVRLARHLPVDSPSDDPSDDPAEGPNRA